MNVKEYIKTNWKIIVIVLLTCFSLMKCTSACTRNQKIKTLNKEIVVKDSTITAYQDSIKYLNINNSNLNTQLTSEKEHASSFEGVASDNVNAQAAKINELNATIKSLQAENAKLTKQVKSLQAKK